MVSQSANHLTFELSSSEDTLAIYPYPFVLRIIYRLEGNNLSVTYEVLNPNSSTMYFSIGAHPAFRCPLEEGESLEDYSLFVDALCHWGRAATGEQILSPRSIELMRTNTLNETCLRDKDWPQLAGYGYGLGVRTMIDPALGGSLSPVGEFGWDGAAGAYMVIDPEHDLSLFYMQHMLNASPAYNHPRIRNTMYADLNER